MYWNKEFDTMPWSEVHKYWLEKLPSFLEYIKNNSSFYKERLAPLKTNVKTLNELSELPFLTKKDLRETQVYSSKDVPLGTLQAAKTEDIVQVISSSGTTGKPVYYGVTKNDVKNWVDAIANFFFTAGIRKEDIVAHIVGVPMFAGGEPYFSGIRNIGAATVWPGGLSTPRIMETIRNVYCTAVQATVSFDLYLAERCEDLLGISTKELEVKKVLGGGEPGLGEEAIRQKMKSAWNAETVREIMGLADVMPGMWAECEEETGMHFCAQKYVMVELLDTDTEEPLPWEKGVKGMPVYTTFEKESMPVLRYRSNDLVRIEETSCKCGRTSPKIRCVGRVDDMLVYKAMNVYPSAIRDVILTHFEKHLTGNLQIIKDYEEQVRFDSPIPVEIEVKAGENTEGLAKKIDEKIREILNIRVKPDLVPPDTIEKTQYKTPLTRVKK